MSKSGHPAKFRANPCRHSTATPPPRTLPHTACRCCTCCSLCVVLRVDMMTTCAIPHGSMEEYRTRDEMRVLCF
eukprot:SAG31_NODE_2516_length_5580_cov_5.787448_9_plen_74_part_00